MSTASALHGLPGESPSFRWNPDAVRRLYEDVEWARTSNPKGPAEIVGLILGKHDGLTQIVDCEPVLLLEERDRASAQDAAWGKFERAMTVFRSTSQGEICVLGFYRSDLGQRFDLNEEDLRLAHTYFPEITPLILLIQLYGDGSSRAKLFVGERVEAWRDCQSLEAQPAFPTWLELWDHLSADRPKKTRETEDEPRSVARTGLTQPEEPAVTTIPQSLPLAFGEVQDESLEPSRRLPGRWVSALAGMIVLAVLIPYLLVKASGVRTASVRKYAVTAMNPNFGTVQGSGLALRVQRQGEDLRLDWDRRAPLLVSASGGMLTIQDGNGRERHVLLDMKLLTTGSVVYRPVHGSVVFRLVMLGQNGVRFGEFVATYPQASQ